MIIQFTGIKVDTGAGVSGTIQIPSDSIVQYSQTIPKGFLILERSKYAAFFQ